MKRCESLTELRRECDGVKSGCAGDTIFGAKALMFIAEQLHALARDRHRSPRKPSSWQKFFAKKSKLGLPAKAIAAEWKRKRP